MPENIYVVTEVFGKMKSRLTGTRMMGGEKYEERDTKAYHSV